MIQMILICNKKRRVRLKINPQCFFLLSSVLILVYVYLLDRIDFSFHQQELSNNNRNVVSRTSTISVDNFTKLNNNNNRVVSSYEPKQSPSPLRTTTLKKHQQNTSDNNTTEIQQQQQLQMQMHEGPTMPPQSSSYDTFGFIHIGKTAGSTTSNLLRNGCHSLTKSCRKNIPNESTVSKLVEHYYHVSYFSFFFLSFTRKNRVSSFLSFLKIYLKNKHSMCQKKTAVFTSFPSR